MNLLDNFSEDELGLINIQFLGLDKNPWEFSRGARTQRRYTSSDGKTIIKDFYQYTYKDEKRSIKEYTRVIEWYDPQGNVILQKILSVPQNIKSIKSLNREIRQGRIDYLEAAAEELREKALEVEEPYKTQFNAVADSIDFIFTHYDTEILHYINRGTMEFEDAVRNETDPNMVAVLSIPARKPDFHFPNGLTIGTSILHQLTGEGEVE